MSETGRRYIRKKQPWVVTTFKVLVAVLVIQAGVIVALGTATLASIMVTVMTVYGLADVHIVFDDWVYWTEFGVLIVLFLAVGYVVFSLRRTYERITGWAIGYKLVR